MCISEYFNTESAHFRPFESSSYVRVMVKMEKDEFGCITFTHLPIQDTPMLLLFGKDGKNFVDMQ